MSDAEIAAVRVPTLAVVGGADPALPRVQAMARRWPGFARAIRGWIAK
ncbi:MAG TPA: hypothetical protein VFU24_14355 [Burkholderiales bacterium]|nr:hypothetical protein [Burkholderiales bacterium]